MGIHLTYQPPYAVMTNMLSVQWCARLNVSSLFDVCFVALCFCLLVYSCRLPSEPGKGPFFEKEIRENLDNPRKNRNSKARGKLGKNVPSLFFCHTRAGKTCVDTT